MDLRVLRYFLAVVKEESISKAAQALHITQPTLSRQLMELERELGVILIIRGKRNCGIELTSEGRLLHRRAGELVELAERTAAEMKVPEEQIRGDVYIGGGETDAMRFIAQTAKALQKNHPDICYHLYSGNADDVCERLDKGLLDFGVLIEPAVLEKYDYVRVPQADIWGLLMCKDSRLANKQVIAPSDLVDLPLLTSRQSLVRGAISGWYGGDVGRLNVVGTYNLIYNASLMVEEGVGYALCLDKLVNTGGDSNLCFKPFSPPLEACICVAWKKQQVFSKAAELFLQKLQETWQR